MDPTVYLLVFGISIVSARHTLDVNGYLVQSQIDPKPKHNFNEQYSAQDVERRNVDFGSNINPNQEAYSDASSRIKQPKYSNQRQQSVDHLYITESDHVALISEKVDSSNNIGNDVNEFKLRTNAYPTKRLEIMEFTTESINKQRQTAHPHIEEQNVQVRYRESELNARESSKTEHSNQRNTINPRGAHQRSLDMAPETGFIPQVTNTSEKHNESSGINAKNHNNTMHVKMKQGRTVQSDPVENKNHVPESFNVRPLEESSTRQSRNKNTIHSRGLDESGGIPKEKDEEEIPWVWGTQPGTKLNTTEVDDLDDRAAFDGSHCATGYVKVMGICVEKH